MRRLLCLSIAFTFIIPAFAQKKIVTSELLTAKQVREVLSDTVRRRFNIYFPISRVYSYTDRSGQYYCILTESRDEIAGKDTFNHTVKAISLKAEKGAFIKLWEINDNIIKNEYNETSIWFSKTYTEISDFDGDGLIDPIVTYCTTASNGLEDGRIKFIIYHKGHKIAIRHQNGVLDFDRETQVDRTFYTLPGSLQAALKKKMELMEKNNHAIFPAGWQAAMKNRKTSFNERQ